MFVTPCKLQEKCTDNRTSGEEGEKITTIVANLVHGGQLEGRGWAIFHQLHLGGLDPILQKGKNVFSHHESPSIIYCPLFFNGIGFLLKIT